nr:MAG TPA: protein of unknown function (DUF4760) [Caudoviricetes sp.]
MQDAIKIFGETIGFWVQTGAFVLSALGAVGVIWHNGKAAKRRATIDLIISEQRDIEYNQKYASVSKLINSELSLVDFAKYLDEPGEDCRNVLFVLNRLEFIAQGIRVGAFEEKIFKDLKCTNFLKLWRAVNPLISEIRRKKEVYTYFQEIEWLAVRWERNKIEKL